MNKNEPKKSPAEDFFAWLHSATAIGNPDIHVWCSFRVIEVSRASSLSRTLLQGFFLNAFAAFARGGSEIKGRGKNKYL